MSAELSPISDYAFRHSWDGVASVAYGTALDKGWWDDERSDGECIALMHSELSEALEGLREGNPPDKHLPDFSSLEVELADVVIRIMDYAKGKHLDVASALVAKINFNQGRERKHGGKAF